MVSKGSVEKQEAAVRREAMETGRRTGNYRFDPFKNPEVRKARPDNCYGCTWERQPDSTVRLKFAHKLCYPQHEPEPTDD